MQGCWKRAKLNWVWRHTLTVPTLRRPRQESPHKFEARPDYQVRPCLQKNFSGLERWWFTSLTALPENASSIPSIHSGSQLSATLSLKNPMLPSGSHGHQACTWCIDSHASQTLILIIKKEKRKTQSDPSLSWLSLHSGFLLGLIVFWVLFLSLSARIHPGLVTMTIGEIQSPLLMGSCHGARHVHCWVLFLY